MKKQVFLVSMLLLLLFVNLGLLSAWTSTNFIEDKELQLEKESLTRLGEYQLTKHKWFDVLKIWEPDYTKRVGLKSNTDFCGDNCFAEGVVEITKEGKIFTEIEWLRSFDNQKSWVNWNGFSNWKLYIENKNRYVEVPTYEIVCTNTGEISLNGTAIQECSQVEIGTKLVDNGEWEVYDFNKVYSNDTYNWKLEGGKKPSTVLDWVFVTSEGVKLTEWAVWGAVIGEGGVEASVTLNSPADDSTQYTNSVTTNASANVTGGAYLTNMSLNLSVNGGAWEVRNTTNLFGGQEETYSEAGSPETNNDWNITAYAKVSGYMTTVGIRHSGSNDDSTQANVTIYQNGEMIARKTSTATTQIMDVVLSSTDYTKAIEEGEFIINIKRISGTYNIQRANADRSFSGELWNFTNQRNSMSGAGSARPLTFASQPSSSTQTFTNTFNAGDVVDWNYQACDSDGDCGFAPQNFTLSIDNVAPIVNITYPEGLIDTLAEGVPFDLKFTVSDTNLEDCWYEYNGTNTTIPSCENTTFTYVLGLDSITVYANDAVGNLGSDTSSFEAKIIENSQTFSASTVEGALEDFYVNVTVGTGIEVSSGTLHYNGDSQTASINQEGDIRVVFIEDYQIPDLPTTANVTFYWTLLLNDGTSLNLTSYNQSVSAVNLDSCSSYTNQLFNISLFDEELLTPIKGTVEIFYEVQNKPNYDTIQNFKGKFENVSNTLVCSDINLSGQNLAYSTEMRYYANYSNNSYVTELYHIQRVDIGELQDVFLYDLNSQDSTEFKVEYQDSNVEKVEGAIIQLQRKYISENIYRVVEAPITSNEGTAILHIDLDTVKYKATVVKNGVVLDIFDNIVFSCDNELSGQCEQNLYAEIGSDTETDINTIRDFSYSLTSTNNTVDVTYTIPSGVPATINVVMSQYDQFGNETLCNRTIISSGGSTSCSYNSSIGDSYLNIVITKDGIPQAIRSFIIPEAGAVDFLSNNFFIVLIFLLSIVGMAFTSPEWIILNSVLVMLIAGSLYLLNGLNFVMGLGGLAWLVIGAAILIFKIAKQEDR